MRKTVIAVLLLLAVLTLVGCGKKNDREAAATGSPSMQTQGAQHGENARKDEGPKNGSKRDDETAKETAVIGSIDSSEYTVLAETCFKQEGFDYFAVSRNAVYTVDMDSAGTAAEWSVYVLDDKFSGDLKNMPQGYDPVLTEDGSIEVRAGQYVYVFCSVNSLIAREPAYGATVKFTGAGLP